MPTGRFEGNLTDATGSYSATAVNTPSYEVGVIGQAFRPNGGATVPDMGTTYSSVTVSAWIKTDDAHSPTSQAIFHNNRWALGTPHFLMEYGGGSPSPSTTGLVIGVNSSGEVKLNNALSTINEATWYHVAYTYNTTATSLDRYINGALAGSATTSGSVLLDLNDMVIGSGLTQPFNGLLDDMGVWNEMLTATQVKGISSFALSGLNYAQADVTTLYGLGSGQSTTTSNNATWEYATGLSGGDGEVQSLGGGLYAMNLGGGTGVQMTAAASVPKPGSLLLLSSGIVGLGAWTRVRKRRRVITR